MGREVEAWEGEGEIWKGEGEAREGRVKHGKGG